MLTKIAPFDDAIWLNGSIAERILALFLSFALFETRPAHAMATFAEEIIYLRVIAVATTRRATKDGSGFNSLETTNRLKKTCRSGSRDSFMYEAA